MITTTMKNAIDKYLKFCKNEKWIYEESYKFEFANFINKNVNWEQQSDQLILDVLLDSQKLKYTGNVTGIQFIQKSGRKKLSEFMSVEDVQQFRKLQESEFFKLNWSNRSMSFTALSAWVASLFPDKLCPVPTTGFDQTIMYLFAPTDEQIPKTGIKYISYCQSYMQKTISFLQEYPIEDLLLQEWNQFYINRPELNIGLKNHLSLIDWVWLSQDFHLFVYRNILGLYSKQNNDLKINTNLEPITVEGNSALANHMRYERDSSFVQKIKSRAIKKNKLLNCEVCGFSFFEEYGEIGLGFIEAHHKIPLSERKGKSITTANDIALVCSNCHRMLHRGNPTLEIEKLKEFIEHSSNT